MCKQAWRPRKGTLDGVHDELCAPNATWLCSYAAHKSTKSDTTLWLYNFLRFLFYILYCNTVGDETLSVYANGAKEVSTECGVGWPCA